MRSQKKATRHSNPPAWIYKPRVVVGKMKQKKATGHATRNESFGLAARLKNDEADWPLDVQTEGNLRRAMAMDRWDTSECDARRLEAFILENLDDPEDGEDEELGPVE